MVVTASSSMVQLLRVWSRADSKSCSAVPTSLMKAPTCSEFQFSGVKPGRSAARRRARWLCSRFVSAGERPESASLYASSVPCSEHTKSLSASSCSAADMAASGTA